MKTLVTGGNGKFASQLKKYINGDYLGRKELDLGNIKDISKLGEYDCIIHTATGTPSVNQNLLFLIYKTKAKKVFLFTSKQGTFLNWKQTGNMLYGIEKLVMNFMIYRFNMEHENCQLVEPGHMGTEQDYDTMAKKFKNYVDTWKYSKNQIYDLARDRFIAY